MKKLISIFSFFLFAFIFISISSSVLAVGSNGSFENGTDPGSSFLTVNSGQTDIQDWAVDSGSVLITLVLFGRLQKA